MALVAAFIKALSFATVKLNPFIAIVIEGALIEAVLFLLQPGRLGFFASGLVMALYPIIQTIVTKSILFGSDFVPVILELAQGFSDSVGFSAGWWILGIYLVAQIILPLGTAYFAWTLKNRLSSQLHQ